MQNEESVTLEKILEVANEIYTNIQVAIYKENTSDNISVNINVKYIEKENVPEKEVNNYTPNYIAFLELLQNV